MESSKPQTIDEYIAAFPEDIQERLQLVRQTIKQEIPEATEVISYAIPAFKLKKAAVYFSGFKSHIGMYPAPRQHDDFKEELKNYKGGKGTVQFPNNKPLPLDLIKRITRHLADLRI